MARILVHRSRSNIVSSESEWANHRESIVRIWACLQFCDCYMQERQAVPAETEGDVFSGQVAHFFSRRLLRLQSRVESIEVKVVSLGKVVRLLQQYTERKDQQYEKQANQYHLLQHKISRVEEIETHINAVGRKYEEITHQIQSQNALMEQLARTLHDGQKASKESEQRHAYEIQEISVKLERLESGLLQQMREEGRRQAEGGNGVKSYNFDELHYKIAQLEQSCKGDLAKMKQKIDKMMKKPHIDDYGLDEAPHQRVKSKQKPRGHSHSLLKRVKSK